MQKVPCLERGAKRLLQSAIEGLQIHQTVHFYYSINPLQINSYLTITSRRASPQRPRGAVCPCPQPTATSGRKQAASQPKPTSVRVVSYFILPIGCCIYWRDDT